MTRTEVEYLLEKFLKVHLDVTTQFDSMAEFTGCDAESKMWRPIWKMDEMTIELLENLIDDKLQTLSWFVWDNECGKKKLKHSLPNKKRMKVVKDVSSLLDVLGY